MMTKQELLYKMQRRTYKEGDNLFEKGKKIDRMVLIQSGIVELSVPYDRRAFTKTKDGEDNSNEFIIERLASGAIINH